MDSLLDGIKAAKVAPQVAAAAIRHRQKEIGCAFGACGKSGYLPPK